MTYNISKVMDTIHELLTRGVDKIYPSMEALEKVLRSGKKLKLYQGFDPTGIQMHIGHMIGLRKLAQWQKLGHKVIFLIGDGTGQAGDPSGKTRSREKYLSNDELRANAKDYVMQASKIVSFEGENPVEILYNGDWLNELRLADLLDIAGNFTLQQMIERDLYQERLKNNEPLNLREFVYPLLQGYDSVAMEVDLELGGSDQMFNMLCGRTLLKAMKNIDKFVMTTPLLTDSQGKKIGKTEGNVIALNDNPADLFTKIMSLPDDIIVKGMEYLTDIPMQEIKEIAERIEKGEDPSQFKKRMAQEIVSQLHGENVAKEASEFSNLSVHIDESLKTLNLPITKVSSPTISSLLVETKITDSKSDAKRLITQGGVELIKLDEKTLNPIVIKDVFENTPEGEHILRIGKKKIVKFKK